MALAEVDTPAKTEADFQFSSLKRKWHAEEGKYLATELRRAQDLNVQQEMELESLRQQVAALSSATSTASNHCCATQKFSCEIFRTESLHCRMSLIWACMEC